MVAARAGPKDFLGQLESLYTDFLDHWRYVRDPVSRELITASPEAIYRLVMAGDGVGVGEGIGAGDCDCATVAMGAMLEATGFPVRIATTADRASGPGPLFGHVFIQALVPDGGWVTLDPVLHPRKKFGDIANYSRIGIWNLDGRLLRTEGNSRGLHGDTMYSSEEIPPIDQWQDVGFSGFGSAEESMPDDWSTVGPMGFGSLVGQMGLISGAALAGIGVEVDEEDYGGMLGARTPMLEISPDDYLYMSFVGKPYHGMFAMGDDGELFQYDGTLGRSFFKRLLKKARKKIKRVARRIKKSLRSVVKRLPFGKKLLKIAGKIKAIAMKVVRPLVKFVGKYASKLAPICAMIPGYGTAIAAGLAAAGKVAKLMQKYGVGTKGTKGKVRGLKLQDPRTFPQFQAELKLEAAKLKAKAAQNPAAFKRMLAQQQARLRA